MSLLMSNQNGAQTCYFTMKNLHLLLLFLCFAVSCVPPKDVVLTEVRLDYNDKDLQAIYDFQNKGQSDSLYTFFEYKDPTYRYATAMAFGSTKDVKGIAQLQSLLRDTVEDVRVAAAYALGQIGDESATQILIANFEQQKSQDTLKLFRKSNAAILEAVGKCGSKNDLKLIATVRSYLPTDTMLLEGQAYSIYRFATRGIPVNDGTQRMKIIQSRFVLLLLTICIELRIFN